MAACLSSSLSFRKAKMARPSMTKSHSYSLLCSQYKSGCRTSSQSNLPLFTSSAIERAKTRKYQNRSISPFTGLCFCKELADWNPSTSSLCYAIEHFSKALEKSCRCPICIDERTSGTSPAVDGNESDSDRKSVVEDMIADSCLVCYGKKDTVLVPCGHYCLCVGCAANITECPLCRVKIMLRQRIFE